MMQSSAANTRLMNAYFVHLLHTQFFFKIFLFLGLLGFILSLPTITKQRTKRTNTFRLSLFYIHDCLVSNFFLISIPVSCSDSFSISSNTSLCNLALRRLACNCFTSAGNAATSYFTLDCSLAGFILPL